jgi:ribonuclease P/MRP protein subunit POP1
MSHNPKRIPRNYRRTHINQMNKSGPSAKKRRPSRKYRRKPSNLIKEYIRRQRNHVWLETHIWHAKRYHMANLWGYTLPFSPCDKRYRSAYKAISKHCLLNDISYYGCIEITASLEVLKESFARLSPECGLTITAKAFMSGCREGIVDLFKIDNYPLCGIGKVQVLWRPDDPENPDLKSVWFFVHPSIYQNVLEEFIVLFDLNNSNHTFEEMMEFHEGNEKRRNRENCAKDTAEKIVDNVKDKTGKDSSKFKKYQKRKELQLRFITRNSSFVRCPTYTNPKNSVTITEFKDTLNRFRLTGPLANVTIKKAFKICENSQETWLESWMETGENQVAYKNQKEFFEGLTGYPSEYPPHMVLALNILDPRVNRPKNRTKAEFTENTSSCLEIPENSNKSAIWDRKARDQLLENLMPTQKLCELRYENSLVPGEPCSLENALQPVPVLLVQRPGNTTVGCGWDVITPAGYGMSVWLSLIYCGAKSGGWREIELMENEAGRDLFLPDTIAFEKENKRLEDLNRKKYFQKPPNKRQNYQKLGIASPFSIPFQQLNQEWSQDDKKFYVLRNRLLLSNLQSALQGKFDLQNIKVPSNSLIPISIQSIRGNPGNNALICLPTKRDLKNFHIKKYHREKTPILTEPLKKDENETQRKSLRVNHKNLLKRLRNRRVRLKRKLQKTSKYNVKVPKSENEKIVEEQYKKMCELWVPNNPKTIRNQCSRETIGYLTNSRFTFSKSSVCGIGYITANAFLQLINFFNKYKSKEVFLLVRAINSQHYLTAHLNIRQDL